MDPVINNMLSQLNSWSSNTYPMALTIYNRPHDNSDTVCIKTYRVLLEVRELEELEELERGSLECYHLER